MQTAVEARNYSAVAYQLQRDRVLMCKVAREMLGVLMMPPLVRYEELGTESLSQIEGDWMNRLSDFVVVCDGRAYYGDTTEGDRVCFGM